MPANIAPCPRPQTLPLIGGPFDGRELVVRREALEHGRAATLPLRFRDGRRGYYILSSTIYTNPEKPSCEILKWQPTA